MFDNHFTEADNYTICLLASARVLEMDSRMRVRRNTGV